MPTILITGAASGLGWELARAYHGQGCNLLLTDINADGLTARVNELGAERVIGLAGDITDPHLHQQLLQTCRERFGRLDVLINNAGVMPLSRLDVLKVDEWNRMIDVNIRGVLHGIAAALPVMQRQRSGQFVNIASIGAYSVVPTGAVYCATKYAVRAISEGLRQEVGGDIRVTLVSPGVVESELAESISDESSREAMKAFRKVAITPDAIARAIAYAVEQPADVDVSELIVRPTASPF